MSYGLVTVEFDGVKELANALKRANNIRLNAILTKNLTQMLNRAREPGGTPVSTELTRPGGPHGELRESSGVNMPSAGGDSGDMGYTKDYAPHVEFGYRTLSGGWVPGQYYLKRNLETQMPIFYQDLEKEVRRLCE